MVKGGTGGEGRGGEGRRDCEGRKGRDVRRVR